MEKRHVAFYARNNYIDASGRKAVLARVFYRDQQVNIGTVFYIPSSCTVRKNGVLSEQGTLSREYTEKLEEIKEKILSEIRLGEVSPSPFDVSTLKGMFTDGNDTHPHYFFSARLEWMKELKVLKNVMERIPFRRVGYGVF